MKSLIIIGAILFSSTVVQANLVLEHSTETIAVSGTTSSCHDKRSGVVPVPQSVGSDFFSVPTFRMNWTGIDQLIPAEIWITIEHPYLAGGWYKCSLTGAALEATFGIPPHSSGTIDMNNPALGPSCALSCGEIRRASGAENKAFSAVATVEFSGYSQRTDGTSIRLQRATSQMRVSFF